MSYASRSTAVACGILLAAAVSVADAADCSARVKHLDQSIGDYEISLHFRLGHSAGERAVRDVSFEYTVHYLDRTKERTTRGKVRKEIPGRDRRYQINNKLPGHQPERVLDVAVENVSCHAR